MRGRALRTLFLGVFLCGLMSCTPMRLKQAQKYFNTTLASLPQLSGFTMVASIPRAHDDSDLKRTCYYADALVTLGTRYPKEEALLVYIKELLAQGWIIQEDEYPDTKTLVRGSFERINVNTLAPSWMIEREEGYQQAKGNYPTFVNLHISYYLPDRRACLGE